MQEIGALCRGDPCDRPSGGRTQQGEDKLRPYLLPRAVSQYRTFSQGKEKFRSKPFPLLSGVLSGNVLSQEAMYEL